MTFSRTTTDAPSCFTPPELATRWRTSPDKILAFIRGGRLHAFNVASEAAGRLHAFNVASEAAGRPRWRIALADVLAFEQARAARPKPAPPRRRKTPAGVIEYF